MEIFFCVLLLLCIVALWTAVIIVRKKKQKHVSAGQLLSSIGITVNSIGLILNGFEMIPRPAFIAIIAVAVVTEVVALILILRQNEF